MKISLLFLIPCILFISSCELYEHTNPFDPETPNNKTDGANAKFEISEHSIRDDFPGIFNGTKVLTVSIINKGQGSTAGEIIGILSTHDNAVRYDVPNYSKGYFEHKETGSKYPLTIYPNEILQASYRIIVSTNRSIPYGIIFILSLTDGFNNKCSDTLTVTIN